MAVDAGTLEERSTEPSRIPNMPMWLHERIERIIEYYQVNEQHSKSHLFEQRVNSIRTGEDLLI
jgi:hypothetical protein